MTTQKIKIAVIIPDGMADEKTDILGGKTPMETANKPYMNFLADKGVCGIVKTVPDDMIPESDTANLAILGYDPKIYSKGRAPLEAASIGLVNQMNEDTTAFRCNFVTLSDSGKTYEDKVITDHSADEITTAEADVLIKVLNETLGNEKVKFYTGISYRHCILWENCRTMCKFTLPHDILGKQISEFLPQDEYLQIMKKSYDILDSHPVNKKRRERGLNPANSIWLWSPGTKPKLPLFKEKYGFDASVIAAVNLIKGIGICAGFDVISVDGATGNFHTNYQGKGRAAIDAFENGKDFVYIHIEAPDECGHRGEATNKIKAIEMIDKYIVKSVYDYLSVASAGNFKIMILPDHPTPTSLRTHTNAPVPFLIYNDKSNATGGVHGERTYFNFCEDSVTQKSSITILNGCELLDHLLKDG